ncbi:MAG: FAD-dependent oxidoreductase, partial [Bacteroidota bacterium]
EARPTVGGRVRTLRCFENDLHAEAGAVFVSSQHHRLRALADRFEIPLLPFQPEDFGSRYFANGQVYNGRPDAPFEWPFELTDEEREAGYFGLLYEILGDPLSTLGDPHDATWPPAALHPLDHQTFGAFLRERGASEGAIRVIRQGFLDTWGAAVDEASALFMLNAVAAHSSAFGLYHLDGGNDRLPAAMAEALGPRVVSDAQVTQVADTATGARVSYTQAGLATSLHADAVVMAV